ncbi:C-X-C motif chemokine 3-like [Clupea harengus]|uniref:C-X-C motif chemokine 3-like n=1 Tax=Clupea harengus TaxID=7950 RepID=A0A6P8GDK9_CLUHA|nr:C-X-C motif chemokine 3-like [Clupea harengus]
MALKSVLAALLLLLLQGHLTQWTERGVRATSVPAGCVCVQEVMSVPGRSISNLSIVAGSSFCRTHIIVTLKDKRRVCLNPDSDQGKQLQSCWKKVKNSHRKKVCLRPAKRNKAKAH